MTRKEQIKSAYKLTGGHASFYDGMMTYSTLAGKAICRIVWNMDGDKNLRYLEKALSGIPGDFSGKLLEVPVGTGVLTMPVYKDLPEAEITCLDYSAAMMETAQKRAEHAGINNITFVQGDVGAMPFEDESFIPRIEEGRDLLRLLLYPGRMQTDRPVHQKAVCSEGLLYPAL